MQFTEKWYYLQKNGQISQGWNLINGKYYFFQDWGMMAQNEWLDNDYKNWYYFTDNGTYAHNQWTEDSYLKKRLHGQK